MVRSLLLLSLFFLRFSFAGGLEENQANFSISHSKAVEEFVEEQLQRIDDLSQAIERKYGLDERSILSLYNERGITLFFMGKFEEALSDFNFVITKLQTHETLEKTILGTALWGKLFCHAFNNQIQETHDDSLMIRMLFTECSCCEEELDKRAFTSARNSMGRLSRQKNFFVLPIAKFATPQEKITKRECRDRTNSIADKMRSLTELIPLYAARQCVFGAIKLLVANALACCEMGHHWTECLGPIADAWLKLEEIWDQVVSLFERGFSIGSILNLKE